MSQALTIDRDTLILKTKGNIVFKVIRLTRACTDSFSSVVCKDRSLVLENFETGVVSYNNALDLKYTFNRSLSYRSGLFSGPVL
ncbi:hypothetical protein CS542_02205 [Pedobacter sp. IW39]|nr:hypothetical protein CS542_02205 [Pedobacter sp. IW39]